MHMYTLGTIWKIREFPHPAGSTANTSFHLMKWSEASSWTGFNSSKNIGKTTIQRKLYCTTKGSLKFATIVHLFLCLKFLRAKKPVLGLPRSIPEIRPMRVLVIIITRKGLRLNSNTNQRPSSKSVLMEVRFITAETRGFFFSRSSPSRIRRSIFATNNR